MRFVSRAALEFHREPEVEPERFECKACGSTYELNRQECPECGCFCIGYRESWLERELDDAGPTESTS
mgnify:CR=1 FL=1|jgi:hypothetical protein